MKKGIVVVSLIIVCTFVLSSCNDQLPWESNIHWNVHLPYRLLNKMSLIDGECNTFMDISEIYIISYPSEIEPDIINALDDSGNLMIYPMQDHRLQDSIMIHFGVLLDNYDLTKNIESELEGYLWISSSEQMPEPHTNYLTQIVMIDQKNDRLIYVHFDD